MFRFSDIIKYLLLFFAVLFFLDPTVQAEEKYVKAVPGKEVVKNKHFPKKDKVELGVDGGKILNQSYVDTYLMHGNINYFFSEAWGFGVSAAYSLNSDKNERSCIESFYNDPKYKIGPECGGPDGLANDPSGKANYGPAYVPIRELNYLIAGNLIWNPVYGKQLILLSATTYFDLFVNLGGGVAMSTYYPMMETLRNNKKARGTFSDANPDSNPGCNPNDATVCYGKDGRPDPESQTNVMAMFGVGQKYHFAKRFSLKIEIRNYTLVGTPEGFDIFFAVLGGAGVRF